VTEPIRALWERAVRTLRTAGGLVQKLRDVGIYGSSVHVSESQAREALSQARNIVEAVSRTNPTDFPMEAANPGP
jgi:hypothetical protein